MSKSVLVTGASTGIGRATAIALSRRGWRVYATVRKQSDADSLSAELGANDRVLLMDITDATAISSAMEVISADGRLDAVVNNAGIAVPAPLEYLPLDDLRFQLEVNLTGQLAVAQAALPMLRETRGRLLFVGSIGGRLAGPMLGPYHASKFGIAGLTDTLRAELASAGVDVILVEPGAVATQIWGSGSAAARSIMARLPELATRHYGAAIEAAHTNAAQQGRNGLPPVVAARTLVRALEARRPKPRYLIGRDARIGAVIAHLPTTIRSRMVAATGPTSGGRTTDSATDERAREASASA